MIIITVEEARAMYEKSFCQNPFSFRLSPTPHGRATILGAFGNITAAQNVEVEIENQYVKATIVTRVY